MGPFPLPTSNSLILIKDGEEFNPDGYTRNRLGIHYLKYTLLSSLRDLARHTEKSHITLYSGKKIWMSNKNSFRARMIVL